MDRPTTDEEALEMFRWLEKQLAEKDEFELKKVICPKHLTDPPVASLWMTDGCLLQQVSHNLGSLIRSYREE